MPTYLCKEKRLDFLFVIDKLKNDLTDFINDLTYKKLNYQ